MPERLRIQTRRTGQETTENAAMEEKQEIPEIGLNIGEKAQMW